MQDNFFQQQDLPSLPKDFHGSHIHFVGIKGTGMTALVEILFHKGAIITGSDVSERFYTDEVLENLGLHSLPFSEKNITDDIEYVIYSSAYKLEQNPDLIEACRRGIPCLLYTQALGSYSRRAYSCGVSGVHGKTSTTGLVGTILKEIDLPSQILSGSAINSFGGKCTYTSPIIEEERESEKNIFTSCNKEQNNFKLPSIFVAETCEYQRHFMSFCPQKIILTSVESDHEDYYPTYQNILEAFVDYICLLPKNGEVIYCADDNGACEAVRLAKEKRDDIVFFPYGKTSNGDFALSFGKVENERNWFSIKFFEKNGPFALFMPGRHEVLDAAAAVALVCRLLVTYGKNPLDYYENISRGLLNFTGGKRRSEIVGRFKNQAGDDVIVIDDYAHHPTAIKTTLEGYREFYKGRKIIVDFMSHTYSRTKALLDEFAHCFTSADELILHKIYSSARENPKDFDIDGYSLYKAVLATGQLHVHYTEEVLDSLEFVKKELNKKLDENFVDGYLFVTMGAGDNWKLGKAILENK